MKKEMRDKLKDIVSYTQLIKKQYNKLYLLDINGDRDSFEFQEIINNIKIMLPTEEKKYNKLSLSELRVFDNIILENLNYDLLDDFSRDDKIVNHRIHAILTDRITRYGIDNDIISSVNGVRLVLPNFFDDENVDYVRYRDLIQNLMDNLYLNSVEETPFIPYEQKRNDSYFISFRSREIEDYLLNNRFCHTKERSFYIELADRFRNNDVFDEIMWDYYEASGENIKNQLIRINDQSLLIPENLTIYIKLVLEAEFFLNLASDDMRYELYEQFKLEDETDDVGYHDYKQLLEDSLNINKNKKLVK